MSSPAAQFKSSNSSAFSLLHGSTLTTIHDDWKCWLKVKHTHTQAGTRIWKKRDVVSYTPVSFTQACIWGREGSQCRASSEAPRAVCSCVLLPHFRNFWAKAGGPGVPSITIPPWLGTLLFPQEANERERELVVNSCVLNIPIWWKHVSAPLRLHWRHTQSLWSHTAARHAGKQLLVPHTQCPTVEKD